MSTGIPTKKLSRRITSRRITVSRPPILIEFSPALIKAGYVGHPRALHVASTTAPVATSVNSSSSSGGEIQNNFQVTAADYYRLYSPVVQQVLSFLGQELTERKAIVVYDESFYFSKTLHEALRRILWDAGLQAVTFLPAMEMVPFAFPTLPSMMIIYISSSFNLQSLRKPSSSSSSFCACGVGCDAHCLAHASGQALRYTYQAASGCLCNSSSKQGSDDTNPSPAWLLDPHSPHNLVTAILKCLEACPRQVRKQVASNLVFSGRDLEFTPAMTVKIAKKVRAVLSGDDQYEQENVPPQSTQQQQQQQEESEGSSEAAPSVAVEYSRVPVSHELKTLADSVGVVTLSPTIRPELYAWMGASAWASHWHGRDPESERFQWRKPPPTTTTTTTATTSVASYFSSLL